jgi:hypothetical protein
LLLSQFLTLYTTPVIYIYLSRFVGFFRSAKRATQNAALDDERRKALRRHAAE